MKIFIITCLLVFTLFEGPKATAQTITFQQVANGIAVRMRDSLQLTSLQKDSIYAINILLTKRKASLRRQFKQPEVLRLNMQQVESKRDQLYRAIINNEVKYQLYKNKKHLLVSAN